MQESGRRPRPAEGAHPARLYLLVAGAGLSLLGVLGFFFDADFGTGDDLASDDLSGILIVNGWRNVIYLATGLLALAFASSRARAVALLLGAFYLALAIWGLIETERGIGSILDAIPTGNEDNALHMALGVLGLLAGLIDGGLPKIKLPTRKPKKPTVRAPERREETKSADV